jgi:hypothetical protein
MQAVLRLFGPVLLTPVYKVRRVGPNYTVIVLLQHGCG